MLAMMLISLLNCSTHQLRYEPSPRFIDAAAADLAEARADEFRPPDVSVLR
jgi:hypothetical protein